MSTVARGERFGDERHFDRGSWLTLGLLLIFTICQLLAFAFVVAQPTDGCLIQQGFSDERIIQACVGGWATPLRVGDAVVRVSGRDLSLDRTSEPSSPAPPNWLVGAEVPYVVRRTGAELTLMVPLQQLGWGGSVRRDPGAGNSAALAGTALVGPGTPDVALVVTISGRSSRTMGSSI